MSVKLVSISSNYDTTELLFNYLLVCTNDIANCYCIISSILL
jgi:hypothetical protein